MLEMKLSFIMIDLMAFQSTSGSPRRKQIASRESFTSGGGLGRARISAKCCFFIDFTAIHARQRMGRGEKCANKYQDENKACNGTKNTDHNTRLAPNTNNKGVWIYVME